MARIIAVCKSRQKGTRKEAVPEGILKEDYGLVGDAHAHGNTHRQVSLLSAESINKMRGLGSDRGPGDFEGVFPRVTKGGVVKAGDTIRVLQGKE